MRSIWIQLQAQQWLLQSKSNDLSRLIYALGIRHIGIGAARQICARLKNIDAFFEADSELLTSIDDVGAVMAESIIGFFAQPHVAQIIDRLKEAGVNMNYIEEEKSGNALDGMTFVITGTLPTMGRKEAAALIEQNGGKVTGSVTKKTHYLINNDLLSASSKNKKAAELGIPILSEQDFIDRFMK